MSPANWLKDLLTPNHGDTNSLYIFSFFFWQVVCRSPHGFFHSLAGTENKGRWGKLVFIMRNASPNQPNLLSFIGYNESFSESPLILLSIYRYCLDSSSFRPCPLKRRRSDDLWPVNKIFAYLSQPNGLCRPFQVKTRSIFLLCSSFLVMPVLLWKCHENQITFALPRIKAIDLLHQRTDNPISLPCVIHFILTGVCQPFPFSEQFAVVCNSWIAIDCNLKQLPSSFLPVSQLTIFDDPFWCCFSINCVDAIACRSPPCSWRAGAFIPLGNSWETRYLWWISDLGSHTKSAFGHSVWLSTHLHCCSLEFFIRLVEFIHNGFEYLGHTNVQLTRCVVCVTPLRWGKSHN